jgi:hypothetical protein
LELNDWFLPYLNIKLCLIQVVDCQIIIGEIS